MATSPGNTARTPRANSNTFDIRSGWTPTFAEDYTVFNATPGRLTSTFGPFSPRPPTVPSQKRPYPTTEDFQAGIAFPTTDESRYSHSQLPPVESSLQLGSSFIQTSSVHEEEFENLDTNKTPKRIPQRLHEPYTGQTATPPGSTAKDSKEEIRRSVKSKMQNDQEPYLQAGAMDQGDFVPFPTSGDMFSYPISAPATAPSYLNNKSFWDTGSNMTDLPMDFTANASSFYSTSQGMSTSGDWTQNSQMFQEHLNIAPLEQNIPQSLRRHRPLMSKPPVSTAAQSLSNTAFDFSITSMPEDPFGTATSDGAVNPGLLFSFPEVTSPLQKSQNHNGFIAHPSTAQTRQEIYQHQQRESLRDKEEPRRSKSLKENAPQISYDKARFCSPVKSNRTGSRRAVSDNRPKKPEPRKAAQHPSEDQRPANFAGKGVYSSGRQSPVKQGSITNLASIPEAIGFNPRTAVTFSIDANGRARTETTIIMDQSRPSRIARSRASSDGWESPQSGSSTDEDPIMIPSRNTSFKLPNSRSMPMMAQFDTSRQFDETRPRKGGSAKSPSYGDPDSETETIIDNKRSGDAASALRKVMDSRRRSVGSFPSAQQVPPRNLARQYFGREAPYRRQSYAYQPSSSNASPTTITDPDMGSPSTDRGSTGSDVTRCVCNTRDGDEFFVQW